MTRGFLAVSAALLVAAMMLSPAMAYTISSSGKSPYTIGSGSPYQYTMGSAALQSFSIGSGKPHQYTMGSGALQPYSIGMGTPAFRIEPSDVKAPVVPEVVEPVVEPEVVEVTALMNIVETAVAAGNFNTLVAAVEAAGLAEVLSSDGPFTVFAPTDDAFALLGEIDLEDVEALTRILTYHVVAGEYMAEEVADMVTITTLEGSDLTVEVTDEGVRVNGALVILADVVCS
ncbi:MAG: fasciclin domain-containing protein, partial [Methanothrix sp.]